MSDRRAIAARGGVSGPGAGDDFGDGRIGWGGCLKSLIGRGFRETDEFTFLMAGLIAAKFKLLPAIEDAQNDNLLRVVLHHEGDADATLEADNAQALPKFVAGAAALGKHVEAVHIADDAVDVVSRRGWRRAAINQALIKQLQVGFGFRPQADVIGGLHRAFCSAASMKASSRAVTSARGMALSGLAL